MTSRILTLLILILSSFYALPQSLILSDDRLEVKEYIHHLRDARGNMTFNDVLQKGIPKQHSHSLNFGFDEAAHWFAFPVTNHSDDEKWLLEIAFAPLDRIDFFIQSDSNWIHKTAGDLFPITVRDIEHTFVVFEFSLAKGESKTIYLRVSSTSSIQVPAIFWKRDAFFISNNTHHIFHGVFYGAMLVMILYQLFLFLSTRDKITLYYVFTLFAMMHVVAFFQGYSFLYLYPQMPELNQIMAIITGPIFLIFSTWLTRAFLNLKQNSPWLDKMLLINMELDVLAALMMFIFFGKISFRFHHYALLIHCVLALFAAGYCLFKNFRPALFYLLSWLTLLLATLIFSMSNLGVFAGYLNTNSVVLIIGCIVQMLLISFALGNRWNIMNRENQKAKESELKRGEIENAKLEKEVALRLEEIKQKNQKLEEVNQIKDKLFSIVSHDIKGPLSTLHLALALTKDGTVSQTEFQQLTHSLEARFNQTAEFIENLLQWATLQLKGETFHPVKVDVQQLINNTIALLDFEMKNKNLIMTDQTTPEVYALADVNMVRSILRNLLTNAVKFTRQGGAIGAGFFVSDSGVTVFVADNGVGIPLKNQPLIFSLDSITTTGTGQEKGTGLGLLLCKEFVERNSGKIWFKTEEGLGTTFYFTLPIYEVSDSGKSISAPAQSETLPNFSTD